MITILLLAQASLETSYQDVVSLLQTVEPYASCSRNFKEQKVRLAQDWTEALNTDESNDGETFESKKIRSQYKVLDSRILADCKRNQTKVTVSTKLKEINPTLSDDELEIVSERVVFTGQRLLDIMSVVETGLLSDPEISNSSEVNSEK